VVSIPRPVNNPIRKRMILGPYLSKAQPNKKAKIPESILLMEKIEEVTARVRLYSLSIDLKNTPKEEFIPYIAMPLIKKAMTTIQP
jgi:hypothetical protein